MTITNSDGTSPWSRRIDNELDRAVKDQVIEGHAAEELKVRLRRTTDEVDRAVRVILGDR